MYCPYEPAIRTHISSDIGKGVTGGKEYKIRWGNDLSSPWHSHYPIWYWYHHLDPVAGWYPVWTASRGNALHWVERRSSGLSKFAISTRFPCQVTRESYSRRYPCHFWCFAQVSMLLISATSWVVYHRAPFRAPDFNPRQFQFFLRPTRCSWRKRLFWTCCASP